MLLEIQSSIPLVCAEFVQASQEGQHKAEIIEHWPVSSRLPLCAQYWLKA